MEGGRRARASSCATPQNASEESASSRSRRAISAVSPVGPGAAPRRERRRLLSKAGAGRATGASGSQDNRAGSTGAYGWQGRRSRSRSCWRVAWSPGARSSLRRALRAAESSPRRFKWTALSARCSAPGSDTEARAGGEAAEASRRSDAQSPPWKAVMRARETAAGMRAAAWGRNKSMRGRNNHNFQARSDSTLVAAAGRDWICDKAKCMAWRSGPRKSFGGDRKVGQGCCNTSVAQNASRLANAARSRAPASGVSWTVLGWIGTWSEAEAWGCAGSFGGVALAGTGPTAAKGEEELDEAEELEAEPGRGAGGSGGWTAGAGASVDVAAGGALACCTSSDAAASPKNTCSKASCAVAGMYPSGCTAKLQAQRRCTEALAGNVLAPPLMFKRSCASGSGTGRPSSEESCCRICKACTTEAGGTEPASRRLARARDQSAP